ncbi:MAG: biotin--[acetyl-CoA-carboxylase] ligase [Eggerthellaceae bacterium]|jgi:BirA family biotin operon repressor/biotin-[acetyl-CoA-carboxylase] ligase
MVAKLDQAALSAKMEQRRLPWEVHCFESVASTNLLVKQAIEQDVPEGYVAAALEQRAGYGRQGRSWVSPFGGLYFSILLRPDVSASRMPSIGPALSFAVRQALAGLAACPDDVLIKWPNDVVCGKGKLCGMSCEYVKGAFCIGIGINLFRPENVPQVGGKNRPAYLADCWNTAEITSLDGQALDPDPIVHQGLLDSAQVDAMERVLLSALTAIAQVDTRWREEGFAALRQDYLAHAALIGESVRAVTIDGTVRASGVVQDVDAFGQLLLRSADGLLVPVNSGEIHLQ